MSNGEEWKPNPGGAEAGAGEPPASSAPPPPRAEDVPGAAAPPAPPPDDAPRMEEPPPPPPASGPAEASGATTPPPAPPPPPVTVPMPPVAAARIDPGGYPVNLDVDVPDHIARWRPLVQWFLAIPLFIILYVLGIVAGVVALVGWFAALFTGNLPEGLGDFIAGYYRYSWRAYSYYGFLRDKYPPFAPSLGYTDSGDDPAWFEVHRGEGLSRLAVLFRIILVIPQAIVIFFLGIALYVAMVIAFFAVIITGKWPTGLRDFVVGLSRWIFRVNAWFYLLANPYPPFSLN